MTVPRNVVRDLLPLYASGEASAETRQLVEDWVKTDPELARELVVRDDRPSTLVTARPRGDELISVISQTKKLLRRRALYLALAFTFTALPVLGLIYRLQGVHFPLERIPAIEVICIVSAVVFWTLFAKTLKRGRVAGL
jgi:hypothetical protein